MGLVFLFIFFLQCLGALVSLIKGSGVIKGMDALVLSSQAEVIIYTDRVVVMGSNLSALSLSNEVIRL